MPGAPEKAFQYRPRSTNIFLCPEITLLEFLNGHPSRFENDMAHIIMRPVMVEDPPFLLQPVLEGSSRKGCENREGRKFDVIPLDKFNRFSKDAWIIPVETEDERTVDADLMALNGLDQIG